MTPETRTRIYTLGIVIGILGLVAAVIFGLLDLGSAKEAGLWLVGILGTAAAGTAYANRPTKPQP